MNASRNYPLLLASQFLSAFGDNVILAIIIGQLTIKYKGGLLTDSQLGISNATYTTLFFIPYVLGASLAGYVNDRFPKTRWLLGGNIFKLIGTLLCTLSVWAGEQWQQIGYFIIGTGACVYGPAKYGILPEILPKERLVKANGTVELLTILAILAGPYTGARMIDHWEVLSCYAVVGGIFILSLGLNLLMTPTSCNPTIRLKTSTQEFFAHFRNLLSSPRLARVLLGTGIFWICGAVMKMNFQPWGLHTLHLSNNEEIARLGLWLGLGIIGGSLLAGQFHRIGDLTWTQRYGWLLATAIVLLSLVVRPGPVIIMLMLIGMLAGLFLIPLNAALQAESDSEKLGKTIAAQNFVDNVAMMLGGIYAIVANTMHLSAQTIFTILGILIALAIVFLKIPPRSVAPASSITTAEDLRE